MARNIASPSVIIAFFVSILCTLSTSTRTPFDPSEINNVNDIDQTNNHDSLFPTSVKNPLDDNAIFLPSDNLPEPETLIQYEPQQTTTHNSKFDAQTTKTESLETSKPLPFTVFRFHPIERSRNIPRRPSPLFPHRPIHHRCHHTHNYKPWNNRHLPRRTNDVVITNIDDDIKDFDRVARGGAREIPDDWMRFGEINEPMFTRERSKVMEEKSELLRRIYNRYNQRTRQEQAEREIKDNGSTLVKRIRKFLNGI